MLHVASIFLTILINMALLNDSKYRFVSPLPLEQCHNVWVGKYKLFISLEEELYTGLQMMEDLQSQYHRLKQSSTSQYLGAMKIQGVLSACKHLFARRQKKLQRANTLLNYICSHDSTMNIEFPPGTLIEEEEEQPTFEEWLGL